jgi:inorganic triphosphatase YgiF
VHRSVVTRLAACVEARGAEIEIALDRGAVIAGEKSSTVCELEAELKHGDVAALFAFGHDTIETHGLWLSTIAKSTRGERLSGRSDAPRAAKAKPARLRGSASGEAIFRAVMRSCLDQVLANASVLAEGEIDDEVVHQLRIGIRRMRTAWRELGEWRGPLAPGWEAPAAGVFRALGEYRDTKTVAASMRERLAAAGSPVPALQLPGQVPGDEPVAIVRGRPFQHALLDVLAFVSPANPEAAHRTPDPASGGGRVEPERTIEAHLDKLHARLKRDARRFERLDEPARHGVRKRLKRLRYLSELVHRCTGAGMSAAFSTSSNPRRTRSAATWTSSSPLDWRTR